MIFDALLFFYCMFCWVINTLLFAHFLVDLNARSLVYFILSPITAWVSVGNVVWVWWTSRQAGNIQVEPFDFLR